MSMLRYAITDRTQYGETEPIRRAGVLEQAHRLATQGIDYIQLREKDLDAEELIGLARGISNAIRASGSQTQLLINARADIALASGAHGVHLPSGKAQLSVAQIRQLFAVSDTSPTISISCHTLEDVQRARDQAADLILYGPVFGKSIHGQTVVAGVGLEALSAVCRTAGEVPVLALGGVTHENAASCITAGAKGIAAIRLFA